MIYLNALPFTPRVFDQHGNAITRWNGSTYFNNTPSKSATEQIPVFGTGTNYPLALTFQELVHAYWKENWYGANLGNLQVAGAIYGGVLTASLDTKDSVQVGINQVFMNGNVGPKAAAQNNSLVYKLPNTNFIDESNVQFSKGSPTATGGGFQGAMSVNISDCIHDLNQNLYYPYINFKISASLSVEGNIGDETWFSSSAGSGASLKTRYSVAALFNIVANLRFSTENTKIDRTYTTDNINSTGLTTIKIYIGGVEKNVPIFKDRWLTHGTQTGLVVAGQDNQGLTKYFTSVNTFLYNFSLEIDLKNRVLGPAGLITWE